MNYYEIAKTAYCTEGDQWDCRCCEMREYLENHNFDTSACREKLIVELVKIIDKYKKYDSFLAAHGCFESKSPADVREVKHGKWIRMSDADGYYYCCSVCGESLERILTSPCTVENPYPDLVSCSKTRFCPSCGVVMDE